MSDDFRSRRGRSISQHALNRLGVASPDAGDPLSIIHSKSFRGKAWLLASRHCGCFYCLKDFSPDRITRWVDDGQTALCPYCEIDSVIAFETQSIDRDLLDAMHRRWFKKVGLTAVQWEEAVARDKWPVVSN